MYEIENKTFYRVSFAIFSIIFISFINILNEKDIMLAIYCALIKIIKSLKITYGIKMNL